MRGACLDLMLSGDRIFLLWRDDARSKMEAG